MKTETSTPQATETTDPEWERRMDVLRAKGVVVRPRGAWRKIIGSQVDDEVYREAMRLGAEWRAKANAEGR